MVTAGVVVLALVVVGTAIIAAERGFPGPGATSLCWHIGIAALVLCTQIAADRRRAFAAFLGAVIVVVAASFLLVTQWWS